MARLRSCTGAKWTKKDAGTDDARRCLRIFQYILRDILDRGEVKVMESAKVYTEVKAEFSKDGRLPPTGII